MCDSSIVAGVYIGILERRTLLSRLGRLVLKSDLQCQISSAWLITVWYKSACPHLSPIENKEKDQTMNMNCWAAKILHSARIDTDSHRFNKQLLHFSMCCWNQIWIFSKHTEAGQNASLSSKCSVSASSRASVSCEHAATLTSQHLFPPHFVRTYSGVISQQDPSGRRHKERASQP